MLLALDISSASTGYAVFDQNDRSLISYGTLRLPDKEWFVRGHKFFDWLTTTIKSYNITHIIAEDCFSGKNANTFKVLARLQAMAGLAASKANIYPVFIMPSAWRCLLGEGTGLKFNFKTTDECKAVVECWVKSMHPGFSFANNDETDAIGIGYSAILRSQIALTKPEE